ncbi:MAG: alpha/beta hydrolase [Ginsengibacter sp.]
MSTTLSNETEVKTEPSVVHDIDINRVRYQTIKIEGQDIFYRETGSSDQPAILLLHGFPSSSHMFRNLLIALGGKYHLVAPDYPGFCNSSMPSTKDFEYSFDHLANVIDQFTSAIHLKRFSLYMMDYGAPVGFRIATQHPEKIQALLIQNGNAYVEGLSPFWDGMKAYWKEPKNEANINFIKSLLTLEGTKSQYLGGVRDTAAISPDNWIADQRGLDRPGSEEIQFELFYSYRTNPPLYPDWQAYLRKYQPPTLITWGKNDGIFPDAGAYPFKKDLKDAELHILDTGHFALEEDGTLIASLIDQFLAKNNIG